MKKQVLAVALAAALATMTMPCGAEGVAADDLLKPAEAQLLSEGEDTRCEVEYRAYRGKHGSMFLSKGDKIAVISPSALPSQEQVKAVVTGLKKWGYEPVEGKYVCVETRTLDDICRDLEWALKDPGIKAIFCVRGGYGASEVADILPESLIKNSGKLIIGYSDITVYHSAWSVEGLPSIHASMSAAFDNFPASCLQAEENLLKGVIPAYTCAVSSYCKRGKAKGILIGGNLSTFTSVLETAYDCTRTGQPYILFLEDESEDLQHIHRYLTILKHTGVLDRAAGIVFGEWTELPASMADYDGRSRGGEFSSVADMIARQFVPDLKVPVAFGFPAGHGGVNYPLLMGEMAELKVGPDSYRLVCGSAR